MEEPQLMVSKWKQEAVNLEIENQQQYDEAFYFKTLGRIYQLRKCIRDAEVIRTGSMQELINWLETMKKEASDDGEKEKNFRDEHFYYSGKHDAFEETLNKMQSLINK